ncbi:UNVERIFIED_CONTAM: Retrovirus-related Pol polyprotein from type-1 retrotransposable element R2 [Sesamum radiatum]|uniref:Retrovirus-related Pol polyprotein from type-1 retrotransposable element R2 n=1 Tax=Sesamum radiatum TaxID=300843 RepID=A0AAW2L1F8_SESRA
MSPIFYQKYWSIVGPDEAFVLNFLNNASVDPLVNFTHIVLIPKCPSPMDMSQFRPISLCNVLYKIASKAIANRIKLFLDSIVSNSQAVFVLGRLITDNVLTAFELNHCLKHKTKGKKGYVSLKLDISKAYDRVEWGFLERVLIMLGFHSNFINLIMLCVSSVTFSFLLNGEQFGFLRPERGLQQGDPLSPYLFLFRVEALSGLLKEAKDEGNIRGVAVSRTAPPISHLLLYDDTLVFCEASTEGLTCVKIVLTTFEQASGLKINLLKSAMVVNRSVEVNKIEELAKILGVEVVARHDKYLGLPTLAGRSKRELFEGIKDRFWSKLNNWTAKQLSQASRAVLIQTVLQMIPTCAMSCFRLPDSVLARGGLGFRRLKEFNLSLLTKQAWRISMYPECLPHQIQSQKYFSGLTFFEARLGSKPSYTWSYWSSVASETCDISVDQSTLLIDGGQQDCILSIKSRGSEARDELIWHFEVKGCFFVKSAYRLSTELHEEGSSSQQISNWKFLWKLKAPPKVVLFAWRCARNLLPTAKNLKRKGVPTDGCIGCARESEDSVHFLLNCSYEWLVWALSGLPWAVVGVSASRVEDWFIRVHRMLEKDEWGLLLSICWGLWWARNLRLFEGWTMEAQMVIRMTRRTIGVVDSHSLVSRTEAAVF